MGKKAPNVDVLTRRKVFGQAVDLLRELRAFYFSLPTEMQKTTYKKLLFLKFVLARDDDKKRSPIEQVHAEEKLIDKAMDTITKFKEIAPAEYKFISDCQFLGKVYGLLEEHREYKPEIGEIANKLPKPIAKFLLGKKKHPVSEYLEGVQGKSFEEWPEPEGAVKQEMSTFASDVRSAVADLLTVKLKTEKNYKDFHHALSDSYEVKEPFEFRDFKVAAREYQEEIVNVSRLEATSASTDFINKVQNYYKKNPKRRGTNGHSEINTLISENKKLVKISSPSPKKQAQIIKAASKVRTIFQVELQSQYGTKATETIQASSDTLVKAIELYEKHRENRKKYSKEGKKTSQHTARSGSYGTMAGKLGHGTRKKAASESDVKSKSHGKVKPKTKGKRAGTSPPALTRRKSPVVEVADKSHSEKKSHKSSGRGGGFGRRGGP